MNEQMVNDIVKEVIAKLQLSGDSAGMHGVFKDMNDAIAAAKAAQAIVRNMSMDQREKIISNIRKLTKENAALICDKLLMGLGKRLEAKKIRLSVTAAAKQRIVDEGYSDEYGARPLKRTVQKLIEDGLSEELLRGTLHSGTVIVDSRDGKIVFYNA